MKVEGIRRSVEEGLEKGVCVDEKLSEGRGRKGKKRVRVRDGKGE